MAQSKSNSFTLSVSKSSTERTAVQLVPFLDVSTLEQKILSDSFGPVSVGVEIPHHDMKKSVFFFIKPFELLSVS